MKASFFILKSVDLLIDPQRRSFQKTVASSTKHHQADTKRLNFLMVKAKRCRS